MPLLRRELLQMLLAPRVDYRDYSRVLPDFMTRIAAEGLQRRNLAMGRLTTPAAIRERQSWARSTFWKLIGGEPSQSDRNTPLNARVTGSLDRPGYRLEKVIYESRPSFFVTANLYIPKQGSGPYPAVLFQCGHSNNGKAAGLYQYCCQGLAQLGFLVLAFDPTGQGERISYAVYGGNASRLASADDEHTVPGKQLLLAGLTSTHLQTWDAVRSLDYLAQHPLADPKRLATTGNSGGGTLSMFLAAVDSRLACISAACPNTENLMSEGFNSPGPSDDAEQNIIDSGPAGFDRWDTLYPFAPKPLQIIVSARDFFGTYGPQYIANGRSEFARLRQVYRLLGNETNLDWVESPIPHGLSYNVRMEIYRWFRLHLQKIAEPLKKEPAVQAETDDALQATRSGNVMAELQSLTPRRIAVAAASAKRLPPKPDLKTVLRLGVFSGTVTKKGEADSRHARMEAVEIESERQVFLPAWVFRPKSPQSGALPLILLEPAGRNAHWNEDSLCQGIAAKGITVWSADLRGMGDLRPEFPRHAAQNARAQQGEEAYAWSALVLGRPLLGQRVTDLLAVAAAIPGKKVLAARGSCTVIAQFAAALDSSIVRLLVLDGPKSYQQMLEVDDAGPTANLLFNAMAYTNLSELGKDKLAHGLTWDVATLAGFASAISG